MPARPCSRALLNSTLLSSDALLLESHVDGNRVRVRQVIADDWNRRRNLVAYRRRLRDTLELLKLGEYVLMQGDLRHDVASIDGEVGRRSNRIDRGRDVHGVQLAEA